MMNIVCFVMIRNESPILDPFLDQLETFFDFCVIVDHDSTDDSVEKIRARNDFKHALYHLKSSGYPQATIATFFARNLLSSGKFDVMFFLDCDEFLPFGDRKELVRFLENNNSADVVRLNWVNCCGASFESENIFAYPFERAKVRSPIQKIILRSSLWKKMPDFSVLQGYHGISETKDATLEVLDSDDAFLIHIPIQSRTQIAIKLVNGHNRLVRERTNLAKNLGYHWVDSARDLCRLSYQDDILRALALGYPANALDNISEAEPLNFEFPYVKTAYRESSHYLSAQIAGMIDFDAEANYSDTTSFSLVDSDGSVIFTSYSDSLASNTEDASQTTVHTRPLLFAFDSMGEDYSALIEPLFNLPAKLPGTAWEGHIPFMFVLFKHLAPKTYVELGVHCGGSFIAACTAAKSYNIRCQLFGVDTWEGDDHAGQYDGEQVYQDLKEYLDREYPSARLVRDLFTVTRSKFSVGSVDLLHIDGLHTYEAVKNDFTTWLSAMAPSGVILFHDICVYEGGFGVHRLWTELKEQFETIEFHHSHGLGVLFLDPNDQRAGSLRALGSDKKTLQFYSDLVAGVAGTLKERTGFYFEIANQNAELAVRDRELAVRDSELATRDHELATRDSELAGLRLQLQSVYESKCWQLTRPLRILHRLFGLRS